MATNQKRTSPGYLYGPKKSPSRIGALIITDEVRGFTNLPQGLPVFNTAPKAPEEAEPTDTGVQSRGYVDVGEKDIKSTNAGGAGGNAEGILADSQPLGITINEENRYMLRKGAILLR